MKISSEVQNTIKKINQIIKSMEKETLQKSQAVDMGTALHQVIDKIKNPMLGQLLEQLPGGFARESFAGLSSEKAPWLTSVKANTPSILQSAGIANGGPEYYNQKPITSRPRILVVGPDGAGLDHADAYFYTHSMLSRAMKLLGISHSDEPIWITMPKPEFASSYILGNNYANNIDDTYDRQGLTKASLSTPGLVEMFARTFGHDTFELPVLPSNSGNSDVDANLKILATRLAASLADHVIVLGTPKPVRGRYADTRQIAMKAAEDFELPILQTSYGFDDSRSVTANDLRSNLLSRGRENIPALLAEYGKDPMNIMRREAFKNLVYTIRMPKEDDLKTFGDDSMRVIAERHDMIRKKNPDTGKYEYLWGYADKSDPQNKNRRTQRNIAFSADVLWPRLMSPSVYSKFAGSFHYGVPPNGSPLWGPSEFPHDMFYPDPEPRKLRRILPLLTMTPHADTAAAESAQLTIPYLLDPSGEHPERSFIDTHLPSIHANILGNSAETGNSHTVLTKELFNNQAPSFAARFPSSFSGQFIRPREALSTDSEPSQYFGAFCTNLKRYYDERPEEFTSALRGTVNIPENTPEDQIPEMKASKINESRSRIAESAAQSVIESHQFTHGTLD